MDKPIDTRTTVRAALALAQAALEEHVCELFDGRRAPGQPPRSFHASVSVQLGTGTTVEQEVEVHAGRVCERDDGALTMALRWVPERSRAFPSFDGELRVLPGRGRRTLELEGSYHVPFGPVGLVGDVAAGRRVAQRSLDQLVVEVGRQLDRTVDEFRPRGGMRVAPRRPVDALERERARPLPGLHDPDR